MIDLTVFTDHETLSRAAADWLIERVRAKPNALLCAASGSTPHRAYELFAKRRELEPALFQQLRLIKLDEWGGLPMEDPATCETHLRQVLVEPLALQHRFASFQSDNDSATECARIALWHTEHGPIDLCVLGLGLNGHLGFNEPADALHAHAHVAELSETSLTHVMLSQSARRPTHGLTLGMADLLQSGEILLLVSGAAKRAALTRLLRDEITTHFPASFLALHPRVQVYCDRAASTGLDEPH